MIDGPRLRFHHLDPPNLRFKRKAAGPPANPDLLFFADFGQLSPEEFEARLGDALHRDSEVYRLLIRNIHNQGRYLISQKYRYIRWSYTCFVGAIFAGAIAELVRIA